MSCKEVLYKIEPAEHMVQPVESEPGQWWSDSLTAQGDRAGQQRKVKQNWRFRPLRGEYGEL